MDVTARSILIGVDIGGTFTDVVMFNEQNTTLNFAKVLTRYDDIVGNIAEAIEGLLARASYNRSSIARVVHGTTIATNVVIQESGARMALLTTAGFEDVLEIGRLKRQSMYDLNIGPQTPGFLAPRRRRFGVPERMSETGEVIRPLDVKFVENIFRKFKRDNIESVAVAYLFSYVNPKHEEITRDIGRRIVPDLPISMSSAIDPKYREYERTVCTAFDAYLRPKVENFLKSLQQRLTKSGIDAQIQIMQSRGGVTSIDTAAHRPVNLFLSGPAAGVVGASRVALECEVEDAIAMDIGGTSSDVAIIRSGTPSISYNGQISGFPVRIPMVDMSTIGAGGGSIIWTDSAGGLRVGPKSAGSEPGPVCYRRGGTQPTITDASVVLGYLNPKGFGGGALNLDREAAEKSIAKLAQITGLSTIEAALGAHRIVNSQMAEQIRLMTLKRGLDPRSFSLVAFGGGGPLHSGALMSMLSLKKTIIPQLPGVLSAYGLLSANAELEQSVNFDVLVSKLDADELLAKIKSLSTVLHDRLVQQGFDSSGIKFQSFAEMRYVGQSYELTIPIESSAAPSDIIAKLGERYFREYELMYGYSSRNAIEIVNLKVLAYNEYGWKSFTSLEAGKAPAAKGHSVRSVWFLGYDEPQPTPILDRSAIEPGHPVTGPAIIEQRDTTIVLYPHQIAEIGQNGNLIVSGQSAGYEL